MSDKGGAKVRKKKLSTKFLSQEAHSWLEKVILRENWRATKG
jgi:hypothetical protein